eukprot:gene24339-30663_t
MEHFAKAGGDKIEEMEALDEERQFIRELALMTEKLEGGWKAGFLSSGPAKKKTASPTTSSTSAPVTEAEKQAKAEYKLRHKEYHTTEVEEEPVENIFSQQKSFLHSSMSRGATGGMKPLPKIPRGETTKLAFDSVGGIKERIV